MAKQSGHGWQTQASRTVRPFKSAAECLTEVGLRLFADEEFRSADVVSVDEVDLAKLAVAVRVPAIPTNLDDLVGLPLPSLQLIVSFEDRLCKDSFVALKLPVSDLSAPRVLEVSGDDLSALSWSGEIRVHVAIVLTESRREKVGTACRVGSWVARKSFSIGKARETSSFSIDAVEPEYFEKRGLPKNSTYLVEINDPDLNQPHAALPELISVSLAKDVHTALARDESSATSRAIMKAIYVDVATTVLMTGFSSLSGKLQTGTILDGVVKRIQSDTRMTSDQLWKLAKEPGGASLRAVVQAAAEFSRSLVSATQRTLS